MKSTLALLAAAAFAVLLAPATATAQSYATGPQIYGVPKAETVKAKAEDIQEVDMQAQALVDQLRAGSPTAVDYATRAKGALIFPNVTSEARLLLGETNALGVLYVKDGSGAWTKHSYYQGRRSGLGFGTATGSSSRLFMFMNDKSLIDFIAGEITAKYMKVDPVTGDIVGDLDADIAAFITNVRGDQSDPTFNGLWIAPVALIN